MVNFKKLADRAKGAVEKRGGTDALKQDAGEVREIFKGEGSLKDKAKQAAAAVKDPGKPGEVAAADEPQAAADAGEETVAMDAPSDVIDPKP